MIANTTKLPINNTKLFLPIKNNTTLTKHITNTSITNIGTIISTIILVTRMNTRSAILYSSFKIFVITFSIFSML